MRIRFKRVLRYDPTAKLFRIGRFMWEQVEPERLQVSSNKFSISLRPKLFDWYRTWDGWTLTVLGIRLHRCKAYGGYFT